MNQMKIQAIYQVIPSFLEIVDQIKVDEAKKSEERINKRLAHIFAIMGASK